jgi:UDP-N-acetylglucosamine 2-epimerase
MSGMKKLKVMTVVGTRPEIIRLSRVIASLDKYCEHILVHTGQNYNYELNELFFQDLDIRKPDYFLNAAGINGIETIGKILIAVDKLLPQVNPDALLVLGDTNSCMSVLPAKRRQIPTFHMEAGNRCFDMRVPEEINRRIVDHTADINLTYSDIARQYLLREGLPPDMIIKTGSPMFEVLNHYRNGIEQSEILNQLELNKAEFFLVSAHREENISSEKNFHKLVGVLNTVAEHYNYPIIVSTHPRTQKRIDELNIRFNPLIRLMKPLGFKDYNKLQISAKVVLSDSGTITEEASILNFPALNIREVHERPEGMEEASVIMVGLDECRVLQSLKVLEQQSQAMRMVAEYQIPNVSEKVARIIHSYVDYVNRVMWKRY